MRALSTETDFLFYSGSDGEVKARILVDKEGETIWTTQRNIAEIFDVEVPAISKHINNILNDGELTDSTISKMEIVQLEGNREVKRLVDFYNLDMIIAVGYRVNSYNATRFRIWATKTIREFLTKGFVLDDERLKQGNKLFEKDYFQELIERIREIRASERRFYQKITDIYAQCSIDYDVSSPITKTFFATVQNKLEFAITHQTAAELIKGRAGYRKPNMGLTSWKNEKKGGKIQKSDVTIAKNYLNEDEIKELNRIVNMYLDYAENMAERHRAMRMIDWVDKLDSFLEFNEYDILKDSGRISKAVADSFAEKEYAKFRVFQDREYESDFDRITKEIQSTGRTPTYKTVAKEPLSDLNKNLKKALNFDPKINNK